MRLTANWLAQWLVQGDFCSIALDEEEVRLESLTHQEVVSFDDWDGSVTLHRGVMWGAMELMSADQNDSWTIHGLPWAECKHFAEHLVNAYREWAQGRVEKLDQHLPQMLTQIENFTTQHNYKRRSQHLNLQHALHYALQDTGLTDELAASFRPLAFEQISPWLTDNREWVAATNQQWIEEETGKWASWFDRFESSPLNASQREAVLLNEDHNLILAGAGSGKTSVLMARAGYLLASQQADPEDILLLAFGRKAAEEMSERLADKIGKPVRVATFHSLGCQIIQAVEGTLPAVSPLVLDDAARHEWLSAMLKDQWQQEASAKRWQKHLTQWRIPGFRGDNSMEEQARSEPLLNWVWRHIELISQHGGNKSVLSALVDSDLGNTDKAQMKSELALLWPCYKTYSQYLKANRQIDFNSMIQAATDYIQQGKFTPPWRFVMVDEYQDISPHRLSLIEAICKPHGDQSLAPSLYAVGDDWQAIYRFAGADVNLTTGFESRFGASQVMELDTTYRFNNMIGEVANLFIQQNPQQLKKSLKSFRKQKRKAVTLLAQDLLEQELVQLAAKVKQEAQVLLLGRNHDQKPEKLADWQAQWPQLNLQFMTCHASKGREADFVFILNVNRGVFPALDRDRGLLACLQSGGNDGIADAEERRLFYVAMTRAKEQVWICANPETLSPFVNELIEDRYPVFNKIKKVSR
ncbi:DNA helicase IV [Photobacterium sp. GJ3]|uniref:DNA helicase IV n=1 Tax=Photobacterium sp. GJ3 TaxID=2829502 RepID=UPI001B8BE765|nr:DNA helicase IV [Photobacterium sp. GJ3]QUJ66516.1 DNA helicase IV [Photobacterium sp. GJ3]